MDSIDLDEVRNVFIYIMDEMDYHGDPDDLAIYRDIRKIFDVGARQIVSPEKNLMGNYLGKRPVLIALTMGRRLLPETILLMSAKWSAIVKKINWKEFSNGRTEK